MKLALILAALSISVFVVHPQEGVSAGNILVRVTDLRNNEGDVAVALYNSKDGFPGDAGKVFKSALGEIQNGKASVFFTGVPYGEYALIVLHDENRNGKMDKGFPGIPKEGYGASNNARFFMGPPSFEDAKFQCDRNSVHVTIIMKY